VEGLFSRFFATKESTMDDKRGDIKDGIEQGIIEGLVGGIKAATVKVGLMAVFAGCVVLALWAAKATGQEEFFHSFYRTLLLGLLGLGWFAIHKFSPPLSREQKASIARFNRVCFVSWLLAFLAVAALDVFLFQDARLARESEAKWKQEKAEIDRLTHRTPEEIASMRALMEARAKGKDEFLRELTRQRQERLQGVSAPAVEKLGD
jgi:hypothetical protein